MSRKLTRTWSRHGPAAAAGKSAAGKKKRKSKRKALPDFDSSLTLFVSGLDKSKSVADNEKALRESFGAHGAIKEVFIRAAFAFLVFENADDSQKALDASADLKIGDSDKPLVVQRKNQRETPADDDEQE
eukprot:TRINITY_DN3436_c0_g1_i2.p2 TRINITY_DN3436_c0_g1~~TRINITY_DN3436_c0_g1_i2.p2  ORF type:complete len:130 (+),score=73.65 TRINITY_DN3436_c0_g1_i2:549-938(+)